MAVPLVDESKIVSIVKHNGWKYGCILPTRFGVLEETATKPRRYTGKKIITVSAISLHNEL